VPGAPRAAAPARPPAFGAARFVQGGRTTSRVHPLLAKLSERTAQREPLGASKMDFEKSVRVLRTPLPTLKPSLESDHVCSQSTKLFNSMEGSKLLGDSASDHHHVNPNVVGYKGCTCTSMMMTIVHNSPGGVYVSITNWFQSLFLQRFFVGEAFSLPVTSRVSECLSLRESPS